MLVKDVIGVKTCRVGDAHAMDLVLAVVPAHNQAHGKSGVAMCFAR